MKRFKRYEWYKDSGVEWIGKIPLHWEQVRMKFLCKVNPSKSDLKVPRNTKVTFLPMENIGEDGTLNLNEERELTDVWDGFTYFKDDDVIIAKITPCFENGKGALCRNLINGLGFGTTELHVLRAKNQVVPGFIWYVTKSHGFRVMGEAMMQGAAGQKRVPKDFIENFVVCVPTPVEQQAIVNFLDRKTAEIDSIIADKEKLIELLQEKRQAIITQAVTKGLDPNVPMKDSRLKWWGVVPEHWKYLRMDAVTDYHKCNIRVSELMGKTVFHYSIPVIEEIGDGKYEEGEEINSDKVLLNGNEILVSKLNPQKSRIVLVEPKDVPIVCSTEFVPLIPKQVNRKYFWYLYQSEVVKQRICSSVQSATNSHQRANLSDIIKIWFYLPEKEEQQAIASYLDKKTAEIDSLVTTIKKQMAFLKEYRQSLITAAVTGKIDVRDYYSYSIRSEQMEGEEQEEVS